MNTRRGINPDLLEQVLTEKVGQRFAEGVFVALDERQAAAVADVELDEFQMRDVRAAEVLVATLRGLLDLPPVDALVGQIAYDRNNTYLTWLGKEATLSPYAHVLAAALTPLTRLCDGNHDRAEELLHAVLTNHDPQWTVKQALRTLRVEWAREDAEQARAHDPVARTVGALLHHASTSPTDHATVRRLLVAADLAWICAHCDRTNANTFTHCQCGTGRDGTTEPKGRR